MNDYQKFLSEYERLSTSEKLAEWSHDDQEDWHELTDFGVRLLVTLLKAGVEPPKVLPSEAWRTGAKVINGLIELVTDVETSLRDESDAAWDLDARSKWADDIVRDLGGVLDPVSAELIDWRLPEPESEPLGGHCEICDAEVKTDEATVVLGPDGGVFCDDKCAAIKRMSKRMTATF